MKLKTSELTDAALDWAVAKCEGYRDANDPAEHTDPEEALDKFNWTFMREPGVAAVYLINLRYSADWAQGGPIIARERINLLNWTCGWDASMTSGPRAASRVNGDTPLIAAMRCFVASKLGDEVDVPEGLA